jgi:DNA modification methylase
VNDRASTSYPSRRDLDAVKSAKARSVLDGSACAVVLHGDCLARLSELPDASVDSCVCDGPYGLSQDEPDMADVLAHWLDGRRYRHGGTGFQGAAWDAFVPGPEVWREVFRVLKPGGYLLAFGAPRRYDLLCLSIRLAGFSIRDSLHWVYATGNGGTKSHNLSLALDKAAGAKREVIGQRRTNVGLQGGNYGRRSRSGSVDVTAPATEAAKRWDGWGTSVTPAHEPIVVAQKPVEGTYTANLLAHGVGGLNIDGCKSGGRWPKNILFSHSPDCQDDRCAKGCPVAELDAQHGPGISDKFPVFRPESPFRYCAKPSRSERNAGLDDSFPKRRPDKRRGAGSSVVKGDVARKNHHPTTKPVALMAWLCRLVTPPGGVVIDPFAGSGSTGCAAVDEGFRFIGIELDATYVGIAQARIAHALSDAPTASGGPVTQSEPSDQHRSKNSRRAAKRAAQAGRVRRQPKRLDAGSAPAPFPSASVVLRAGHEGSPAFSADDAREPEAVGGEVAAQRAAAGPSAATTNTTRSAVPPASPSSASAPASAQRLASSLPLLPGPLPPSLQALAKAVADSGNSKIGETATTYAAQSSCPSSCPLLDGGGCYAEQGRVRHITRRLNEAAKAVEHTPFDVARAEAWAIDQMKVVPGRPLRLHTVGDCASDEATQMVAAAAARYGQRGGGPVFTYSHAWRDVARESWGDAVSILASCETLEDIALARSRGYAPSTVVKQFRAPGRHLLDETEATTAAQVGVDILPCPEQSGKTRGKGKEKVTCATCRLCFDDKAIRERGYAIAFEVHGDDFTVRQATRALCNPDDPDRRLTSRQLIPRLVAEMRANGQLGKDGAVSSSVLARQLNCNNSSVGEMRKRLATEALERNETEADIAARVGWSRRQVANLRRELARKKRKKQSGRRRP